MKWESVNANGKGNVNATGASQSLEETQAATVR
jgi:hypothetical protein